MLVSWLSLVVVYWFLNPTLSFSTPLEDKLSCTSDTSGRSLSFTSFLSMLWFPLGIILSSVFSVISSPYALVSFLADRVTWLRLLQAAMYRVIQKSWYIRKGSRKRRTIFSPVFRLKFFRRISRSITSLWPPSCYSRDDWPSWMHHSSLSSPIYRHYLSKVSSSIDRCTHRAIYLFVPTSDYLVSREKSI